MVLGTEPQGRLRGDGEAAGMCSHPSHPIRVHCVWPEGSQYRESAQGPNNSEKGSEWDQAPQTEGGIRTRMVVGRGQVGRTEKHSRDAMWGRQGPFLLTQLCSLTSSLWNLLAAGCELLSLRLEKDPVCQAWNWGYRQKQGVCSPVLGFPVRLLGV